MSPRDAGSPRDPEAKKRMLPSVTDVVRALAQAVSADPAVLFKAARGVVGEELARVKQGFESAPLDVLVRRARLQLEREGSAKPVSPPAPPFTPVFPPRQRVAKEVQKSAPPTPAAPAPPVPPASDDPFEAPSGAELGWEKEISIQPEDAPFRSAILPIPYRARGPAEIPVPAPPEPALPEPVLPAPTPERAEPRREVAPDLTVPLAQIQEPETPSVAPPLFLPPIPTSAAPAEPPPVPPAFGAERFLREPSPPPARPEPAVKSMSEMAPLRVMFDDQPELAAEQPAFKAAEGPGPEAATSSRRGWLVAIALVLAVGAGLAWAVREYVFHNEIVNPAAREKLGAAPPPTAEPAPTPATEPGAEPAAQAAKPAPVPEKRAAERASAVAAPVAKGHAAVLLTPDWAGKPAVYVIHFSSLKDRASAEKDAKRLGAALGAPARAVEVDLGEKGTWYRVVVGEFADVDAARAFRADLEAKKTPGMGFVYEMRGR